MATLSYSFHISSKKNAITNKQKLSRALNHNLRSYESKEFDRKQNLVLVGANNSKNAFEDFKNFYKKEFEKELEEYNSNQKREDRKIKSYFDNVSENSKTDLATEIIIQVGDMDFWKDKTMDQKKKMTEIFKNQLELLNKNCNDFKVVNAVIHYDEKSPHIQIIGVPVAEYKNGLKKRVAKTKVFTKESLESLQDKMREPILEQMQKIYGKDINLQAKEQGRNIDLFIEDYIEMKKSMEEKIEIEYKPKLEKLDKAIEKKQEFIANNNIAQTNLKILEFIKNKKQKKKIQNSLFSSEEKDVYIAEDIENGLNLLSNANYEVKVYQNSLSELKNENKALNSEIDSLKLENKNLKKENQKNNYIFSQLERLFPNMKNVLKTINSIVKEYSPWNKEQYEKEINKSLNIQVKEIEKTR